MPWADKRVRQALSFATDRQEILDKVQNGFGEMTGVILRGYGDWWREPNYVYDLDKAKQLLEEAGYGDGFKINLMASPGIWAGALTGNAVMLAAQWAKVGVTLDLKTYDHTTQSSMNYASTYKGINISVQETVNPLNTLITSAKSRDIGGWANWGSYSNSEVDELVIKAGASFDVEEVVRLVKEAALIVMRECPKVPLYARIQRHYWWPWLRNYYGELTISDEGPGSLMAYAWVDESLKKEMGK